MLGLSASVSAPLRVSNCASRSCVSDPLPPLRRLRPLLPSFELPDYLKHMLITCVTSSVSAPLIFCPIVSDPVEDSKTVERNLWNGKTVSICFRCQDCKTVSVCFR